MLLAKLSLSCTCSNKYWFLITASTREVILGTDNGQLHEIAVDEKDKREKYIKFIFELSELPEAFKGLQVSFLPKFCSCFQDLVYILAFLVAFYICIDGNS